MYNERAIRKVLTCLYNDNDLIVVNSLSYELKFISVQTKSVIRASDCVYNNKYLSTINRSRRWL